MRNSVQYLIPKPRLTVSRLTLWRGAASLLASYLFLGVGPDNFRWLYGRHAGLENWDPRLRSNNMYLEFFVGTGLIGGVIFLWFLWRALKTLGQTWQTLGPEKLKLFVGLAMALSAFFLHGLVDSFFEFTPTYLMIWTTVGLSISLKYLNKDSP